MKILIDFDFDAKHLYNDENYKEECISFIIDQLLMIGTQVEVLWAESEKDKILKTGTKIYENGNTRGLILLNDSAVEVAPEFTDNDGRDPNS